MNCAGSDHLIPQWVQVSSTINHKRSEISEGIFGNYLTSVNFLIMVHCYIV